MSKSKKVQKRQNPWIEAIKKITWPKRKRVISDFFVCLSAILMLGLIIGLMDAVITYIISFLYA